MKGILKRSGWSLDHDNIWY